MWPCTTSPLQVFFLPSFSLLASMSIATLDHFYSILATKSKSHNSTKPAQLMQLKTHWLWRYKLSVVRYSSRPQNEFWAYQVFIDKLKTIWQPLSSSSSIPFLPALWSFVGSTIFDDLELGKQLPAEVFGVQVQVLGVEVLQVEVEMGKVEMWVEERRSLLLIDSSFSSGLQLERLSFQPLLAWVKNT